MRSRVTERRFVAQRERAVDVGVRARRQQPGREEIALARRQQSRADEDVHVLIDQAAHPDHQVVVDAEALLRGARSGEILDDAAGRRCGADGLLLDAGLHLPGDVIARDERQRDDRDEDGGDEGQEQLAVEAGAHLAQERRCRRSSRRLSTVEERVAQRAAAHRRATARTVTSARFTR